MIKQAFKNIEKAAQSVGADIGGRLPEQQ